MARPYYKIIEATTSQEMEEKLNKAAGMGYFPDGVTVPARGGYGYCTRVRYIEYTFMDNHGGKVTIAGIILFIWLLLMGMSAFSYADKGNFYVIGDPLVGSPRIINEEGWFFNQWGLVYQFPNDSGLKIRPDPDLLHKLPDEVEEPSLFEDPTDDNIHKNSVTERCKKFRNNPCIEA